MIKGINRQIIEINDTGNHYYEKALLIVKPEFASAHQQLLEREAMKLLKSMDAPSYYKRKRNTALRIIFAAAFALIGGALAYIMFKFGVLK